MQADFFTSISVTGTKEDLKQIIKVLKKLEAREFDFYLGDVKFEKNNESVFLADLKDELSIDLFIADSNGVLEIEAGGPWGHYENLAGAKLFERIADAAPRVSFNGKTEGGTSYTTENIECELKNGILHIESFYEANEEADDAYIDLLTEKVPYDRFLKLFKINEDDYDEDDYNDYLSESGGYDYFMRDDFDDFIDCCSASKINETEYESLKQQMSEEGLDWEYFILNFEGGSTETYDYDPINHKYL